MAAIPLSKSPIIAALRADLSAAIARIIVLEGIIENGGGLPTPDPAFTSNPSIAGIPTVGQALSSLTYTDGVVENGSVIGRTYLLNGAPKPISYVLTEADVGASLVYRNTATGGVMALSAGVTVVAAIVTTGTPGQIGFNTIADNGQGTSSFIDLNRMKSGSVNGMWNNGAPLSQYGYPTAAGSNGAPTGIKISLRRPKSGTIRHVVRHNGVGLDWSLSGASNITIVDPSDPNRVIFDVGVGDEEEYCSLFFVIAGATTFPDYKPDNPIATRDGIAVYELAHEADYLAGKEFRPDAIAEAKQSFGLRWMDVMKINGSQVRTVADRTPVGYCSYSDATTFGRPLENIIAFHNETGTSPWLQMPYAANDGYRRWMLTTIRDLLLPSIRFFLGYGNEVWNSDGPFLASYSYAADVGHDANPNWGNSQGYGILAAQLALLSREVFGASHGDRVIDVFERQMGSLTGMIEAARGVAYTGNTVGDLFPGMAIGFYTGDPVQQLGLARPEPEFSQNKAKLLDEVEKFEATNADPKLRVVRQQLIDEIWHGGAIAGWDETFTLDNLDAIWGQAAQFCRDYGIRHLLGYEGQDPHTQLLALGNEFGQRAQDMMYAWKQDVRVSGLQDGSYMRAKFAILRRHGMTATFILTDYGSSNQYGAWLTKPSVLSEDTRQWTFYRSYNANPLDPLLFELNLIGGSSGRVGTPLTQRVVSFGGAVPASPPVLISGSLPPGVTCVDGVFGGTPTADGSYTLGFEATDANGQKCNRPVTLTIAAAPVIASYDYFSFQTTRTVNRLGSDPSSVFFASLGGCKALDANGQAIAYTPTGDQQGNYPLTNLTDNNSATLWYSGMNTDSQPYSVWYGAFGSKKAPVQFALDGNTDYSPADFIIRGHNGTPPTDGTVPAGGVVLVTRTGLNVDFWSAGPQTFAVA